LPEFVGPHRTNKLGFAPLFFLPLEVAASPPPRTALLRLPVFSLFRAFPLVVTEPPESRAKICVKVKAAVKKMIA